MQFSDLPRGKPGTHVEAGEAARALWLDPSYLDDAFWQYGPGKVFLGRDQAGHDIGIADNRHLITVAGSRAGKGTTSIIPNLLRYEGSVLVLDPKGENASVTAERRGKGRGIAAAGMDQDIYVIDPFLKADVADDYRAGFNPLSFLQPDDPEFIDDCDALADALVIGEFGKENDFWNSSARIVLRGFIAWVAADPHVPEGDRHLGMVRRLLILPRKSFQELIGRMAKHPEVAAGVPREAATFLAGLDDRERANVMATVLANIAFLASPPMAKMLEGSGRQADLRRWKFGGMSIYLCLPAMRLHRHARFLRLYVASLLLAVEASALGARPLYLGAMVEQSVRRPFSGP